MKILSPLLIITALVSPLMSSARPIRLILSSPGHPWVSGECAPSGAKGAAEEVLTWQSAQVEQTIDGFGGCFNEQGWEVLGLLDPKFKEEILQQLFDPAKGCSFNLGRLPMGANDYSLEWFSFDETPGDTALEHFSIERDRKTLIPYLRAALKIQPGLRLWASPWCPPSWMKTNSHYAGRVSTNNDLRPEQAGEEMKTQFRMEPVILETYANYFVRFLEEYRKEGIDLYAVHVQNEPNSAQNFPSCVWRPEDLGTFIGRYLGPAFQRNGLTTEIWLGTIERPQLERVKAGLETDGASKFVKGVGFQWAGKDAIPLVHQAYPKLPLMQTESECGDGSNDWAAAQHTFSLMHHYFTNGAKAYMYWNMVLDETGNSRWGWKQNALISVNRKTHAITYNPEFYIMKHFSAFVKPGAVRIAVGSSKLKALGFQNPDGSRVIVCENDQAVDRSVEIVAGDQRLHFMIPASSFASVEF